VDCQVAGIELTLGFFAQRTARYKVSKGPSSLLLGPSDLEAGEAMSSINHLSIRNSLALHDGIVNTQYPKRLRNWRKVARGGVGLER
jgi:hypothetical protein